MSNKIEIKFNERVDREIIDEETVFNIQIVNQSPEDAYELDVNALGSTEIEAFKKVVDFCSHKFEEDGFVWIVGLTGKTFDLSNSYVRNSVSTERPLTEMTASKPLIVRFEIPAFGVFRIVDLSLWYGDDFLTPELDELVDNGITVTGNGTEFTIDNTVECKVHFIKPTAVTDLYFISNPNNDIVITV